MSFAQIDEKKPRGEFKKTKYMVLGEGVHTIRILENPAKKFYIHYYNKSYVSCLGDDCPVCDNNKKILFENPKEFRKVKGWSPRSERFFVNVLDKTPARYCVNCDKEYKTNTIFSCPTCTQGLTEPLPLNKVRVLAKGKTLFQDLEMLSNTIRTASDEVIDITYYDWTLIVKGKDTDTVITATPTRFAGDGAPENMEGLVLYDLSHAVPELTRSEMVDLMNGTSMKDIFSLRRATKEADKLSVTQPDDVLMADIQSSIDDIFKS